MTFEETSVRYDKGGLAKPRCWT